MLNNARSVIIAGGPHRLRLAGDQVELVALDVGEGRPAGLVCLHVTEPLGAQAQQAPRPFGRKGF